MQLFFALLLSISLHAVLIVGPTWIKAKQRPLPAPNIEVRLVHDVTPVIMADAVSTEVHSEAATIPERLAAPPRRLQGAALHRAQAALSEHQFYPPAAIARGLEGDVLLLLSLSDSGRIVSASIARSSGHAVLDQAALDAALNIGALPGNARQTLFPVSFRLQ
jgi:protein TonB